MTSGLTADRGAERGDEQDEGREGAQRDASSQSRPARRLAATTPGVESLCETRLEAQRLGEGSIEEGGESPVPESGPVRRVVLPRSRFGSEQYTRRPPPPSPEAPSKKNHPKAHEITRRGLSYG